MATLKEKKIADNWSFGLDRKDYEPVIRKDFTLPIAEIGKSNLISNIQDSKSLISNETKHEVLEEVDTKIEKTSSKTCLTNIEDAWVELIRESDSVNVPIVERNVSTKTDVNLGKKLTKYDKICMRLFGASIIKKRSRKT